MMESYSSSGWVIHIHAGVWKVWANYQTFWAIFITLILLPQSSVNLLEIYQTLSCMTGCFHTTVYMYSRMSPLYTCTAALWAITIIYSAEWLSKLNCWGNMYMCTFIKFQDDIYTHSSVTQELIGELYERIRTVLVNMTKHIPNVLFRAERYWYYHITIDNCQIITITIISR